MGQQWKFLELTSFKWFKKVTKCGHEQNCPPCPTSCRHRINVFDNVKITNQSAQTSPNSHGSVPFVE